MTAAAQGPRLGGWSAAPEEGGATTPEVAAAPGPHRGGRPAVMNGAARNAAPGPRERNGLWYLGGHGRLYRQLLPESGDEKDPPQPEA